MIDLNTLHIDPAILDMIPKTSALELSVLPISKQNGVVIVAVPEMFRKQLLADVRFILSTKKVKPIPVSRDNIVAAIHHFYATRPKPKSK
jgi:type II secretory ATPase GspE/PulE/Tfp pilus assembly ATPase PilB-like protein